MIEENPFDDDWRDCLCAHYIHVLQEQDLNNEESLVEVLIATGFTESEINSLRVETLGAEAAYAFDGGATPEDEIAPEFTPSIDEPISAVDEMEMAEPPMTEPAVMEIPMEATVMEVVASEPIQAAEVVEPDAVEPTILPAKGKKKPSPPQQMSLF